MRVASRRLRAALDVFGFCYIRSETKALRREIRQVTGALGPARDLDVLIEFLERFQQEGPPDDRDALDLLIHHKIDERRRLDADLRRTVKDLKRRKLLRRVKEFARSAHNGHPIKARKPEEIDLPAPDSPADSFAEPLLSPRLETLLSWLPEVRASGESQALHSMRIDAKRLRYAMEPFARTLGEDFAGVLADVRKVQEVLGEVHDCDVWAEMASEFQDRFGSNDSYQRLMDHLNKRRDELYRSFIKWWSPGAELDFRRRFLDTVSVASGPVEQKGTGS